jgi:hypothetical protein
MKTLTFSGIILIIFSGFTGQKKDILYAYEQKVIGGKSAYTADSLGNTKRAGNNAETKYYIYLQVGSEKDLKVTELWINGVSYHFTFSLAETPVIIKRQFPGEKKSDTLVRKTVLKVFRILQKDAKPAEIANRKAVAKYRVIVYYSLNGKKRSLKAREIKPLPEVMMQ